MQADENLGRQRQGGFDLIWGAKNIGQTCGLTERQTFYFLESGFLPARKVGGRWVAERGRLRSFFLESMEK